jgi:phage terminase large subunit-like protein
VSARAAAVAPAPPLSPAEQEIAALEQMLAVSEQMEKRAREQSLQTWRPQPGPQTTVWNLDCDEILYGGAAFGSKTATVCALPMQRVRMRGYRALILRRQAVDLTKIRDECTRIYLIGGGAGEWEYKPLAPTEMKHVGGNVDWFVAPKWGSRIELSHCNSDDDYRNKMGNEWDDIFFDELTHFTLKQYTNIIARRRGTIHGIRRRAISTANPPEPGEPGAEWVRARWGPWLIPGFELEPWEETDPTTGEVVRGKGLPARFAETRAANTGEICRLPLPPAASAQILYVAQVGEGDKVQERFSTEPFTWKGARAQSRTFVLSLMTDNKAGLAAEPDYAAKLRDLDPVRAQQLEKGDWAVKPAPGLYFKRSWFEIVPEVPAGVASWYRRWDLAATVPTRENPDPDWTEGPRVAQHDDGYLYFDDLVGCREDPGGTDAFIRETIVDVDGEAVLQIFPIDPGAAGKGEGVRLAQMAEACGVAAECEREKGAKSLRIRYLSGVCSPKNNDRAHTKHDGSASDVPLGRIKIVRGDWNERFFRQAEAWEPSVSDDDRGHDDILDALAGLVRRLQMGGGAASVGVQVIGGGQAA